MNAAVSTEARESSYSMNICADISGIDHRGRPVTGRIVGVDPRPGRSLIDGPYYAVQPDNPEHDPLRKNCLTYVRCDSAVVIDWPSQV